MAHELRIYEIRPGWMDEWIGIFESVVIPTHNDVGVPVYAGWRDDAKNQFVWIREFIDGDREKEFVKLLMSKPPMQAVMDPQKIGIKVIEIRRMDTVVRPRF